MVEKLGAGRYFGHLQGSREVAGLTFSESVYPRDSAIPAHRHEHAFFYLIVEGCCAEVCGREKYSGGPGRRLPTAARGLPRPSNR
jgi:AraC family transcriptional regulator